MRDDDFKRPTFPKARPTHTAFPELLPPPLDEPGKKFDAAKYDQAMAELVFNRLSPALPKNATSLQTVRHEQLVEGVAFLKTLREVARSAGGTPLT